MRRLAIFLGLMTFVSIFGCGGASSIPTPPTQAAAPTPPATPTAPAPVTPHVAGDWQFSATSTAPGGASLSFAGNINQAFSSNNSQPDPTVSGAFHVDGSSCFDRLIPLGLTGTVNADGTTSLAFATTNGQAITLTGSFNGSNFQGTYRIDGGCAGGDQGSVTGFDVPFANVLSGTFTDSTQKTFNVTGDVTQDANAGAQGSFAINGTVTFDTPCFAKGGTLKPGMFPSGSFLLGTLVSLEIDTGNGTLTFVGTLDRSTLQISGSYSVSGGSCDGSGNAVLQLTGYWDY